jgi:hypothetical protein
MCGRGRRECSGARLVLGGIRTVHSAHGAAKTGHEIAQLAGLVVAVRLDAGQFGVFRRVDLVELVRHALDCDELIQSDFSQLEAGKRLPNRPDVARSLNVTFTRGSRDYRVTKTGYSLRSPSSTLFEIREKTVRHLTVGIVFGNHRNVRLKPIDAHGSRSPRTRAPTRSPLICKRIRILSTVGSWEPSQ